MGDGERRGCLYAVEREGERDERERQAGRLVGREGRREGRRDGGMEGGREGGTEGGEREGVGEGREGGREGPVVAVRVLWYAIPPLTVGHRRLQGGLPLRWGLPRLYVRDER